jgi:hypothetical protein
LLWEFQYASMQITGDVEMFYKYVLIYGLLYGILLILDALILGGGHWAFIAVMLVSGELFRLYVNLINPGFDDRIAEKYGAPGRKLAERLYRNRPKSR